MITESLWLKSRRPISLIIVNLQAWYHLYHLRASTRMADNHSKPTGHRNQWNAMENRESEYEDGQSNFSSPSKQEDQLQPLVRANTTLGRNEEVYLKFIQIKQQEIAIMEQNLEVKKKHLQEDPALTKDLEDMIKIDQLQIKRQKNRFNWFMHFTAMQRHNFAK